MPFVFYLIFILLISLFITLLEVFLEYPKKIELALKSKYFFILFIFNSIIAIVLFSMNISEEFKFLNTSNKWLLTIVSGLGGYLFFTTKMNIDKVIKNNDLSGLKSFLSGLKTKLSDELRDFIEEDYPFELIEKICRDFNYKLLNDYINFVDHSINHYSKKNKQKCNELKNLIIDIDSIEVNKKVYYLTNILLEVKDPCWVKRHVFTRFCV